MSRILTLILLIVLACCAGLQAAPDMGIIRNEAQTIIAENDALKAKVTSLERLYIDEIDRGIAKDEQHATELGERDATIRELRDEKGKLPAQINFALSALVMLAAVVVGIFGDMRSAARLLCVSLVVSAIGYAMLMLGFWWAISGLGMALTCMVGVVVYEIRAKQQHKVAGEEIIDGVQQALNVGKVTLTPELKAIFNAAQSSFTRKKVDQVTKGRK
jgi:hypothetical protein